MKCSWLKFILKAPLGIWTRGPTANCLSFFPISNTVQLTWKMTFLLFPLPIVFLVFGVTKCKLHWWCLWDATLLRNTWEHRFQPRLQERQHHTNHQSLSFDDCGKQIWQTPNKKHHSQSKSCSRVQLLSWPYSHTKWGAWLVLNAS